jgi:hypothetical protein
MAAIQAAILEKAMNANRKKELGWKVTGKK